MKQHFLLISTRVAQFRDLDPQMKLRRTIYYKATSTMESEKIHTLIMLSCSEALQAVT